MRTFIKMLFSVQTVLLFLTCSNPQEAAVETAHTDDSTIDLTQTQIQTAGIKMGKIEERQISGVIKANGHLDVPPQQLISVSAPLGGFLKSTDLLPGSKVNKGQLIAVIENPDYIQLQQEYLEARNQAEFNKADYDRQQELARENVNAQKTLQQSKANYLNSLARKNGLAARLKLINIDPASLQEGNITSMAKIYSPINGFVTAVNVNIGKFVNPSDVLFTIVDTEHLHAELTIFEKDILKIKMGQKVRFTLANETSERTATVYLIGREIRQDRTITIHCHIEKEDKNLLPGMYLQAIVETGGVMVTALPEAAIVDYQGKKFVFVRNC
jgi:membrane fusion protein, heavy metal efflux system